MWTDLISQNANSILYLRNMWDSHQSPSYYPGLYHPQKCIPVWQPCELQNKDPNRHPPPGQTGSLEQSPVEEGTTHACILTHCNLQKDTHHIRNALTRHISWENQQNVCKMYTTRQASWRRGETPTCVCLFNTDLIMQKITYVKQRLTHSPPSYRCPYWTETRPPFSFAKALLSTCCSAAVMGWGEAETTTTQTKED